MLLSTAWMEVTFVPATALASGFAGYGSSGKDADGRGGEIDRRSVVGGPSIRASGFSIRVELFLMKG